MSYSPNKNVTYFISVKVGELLNFRARVSYMKYQAEWKKFSENSEFSVADKPSS